MPYDDAMTYLAKHYPGLKERNVFLAQAMNGALGPNMAKDAAAVALAAAQTAKQSIPGNSEVVMHMDLNQNQVESKNILQVNTAVQTTLKTFTTELSSIFLQERAHMFALQEESRQERREEREHEERMRREEREREDKMRREERREEREHEARMRRENREFDDRVRKESRREDFATMDTFMKRLDDFKLDLPTNIVTPQTNMTPPTQVNPQRMDESQRKKYNAMKVRLASQSQKLEEHKLKLLSCRDNRKEVFEQTVNVSKAAIEKTQVQIAAFETQLGFASDVLPFGMNTSMESNDLNPTTISCMFEGVVSDKHFKVQLLSCEKHNDAQDHQYKLTVSDGKHKSILLCNKKLAIEYALLRDYSPNSVINSIVSVSVLRVQHPKNNKKMLLFVQTLEVDCFCDFVIGNPQRYEPAIPESTKELRKCLILKSKEGAPAVNVDNDVTVTVEAKLEPAFVKKTYKVPTSMPVKALLSDFMTSNSEFVHNRKFHILVDNQCLIYAQIKSKTLADLGVKDRALVEIVEKSNAETRARTESSNLITTSMLSSTPNVSQRNKDLQVDIRSLKIGDTVFCRNDSDLDLHPAKIVNVNALDYSFDVMWLAERYVGSTGTQYYVNGDGGKCPVFTSHWNNLFQQGIGVANKTIKKKLIDIWAVQRVLKLYHLPSKQKLVRVVLNNSSDMYEQVVSESHVMTDMLNAFTDP